MIFASFWLKKEYLYVFCFLRVRFYGLWLEYLLRLISYVGHLVASSF